MEIYMKTTNLLPNILLVLSLSAPIGFAQDSPVLEAGTGSGGTTGGGNDVIQSIVNLLPDTITIKSTHAITGSEHADIPVGTRTCWLVKTCTNYAREIVITRSFNKTDFIKDWKTVSQTTEAKYKSKHKAVNLEIPTFWSSITLPIDNNAPHDAAKIRLIEPDNSFAPAYLVEILVNGKSVNVQDFMNDLGALAHVLLSQIDFLQYDTFKPIVEFQSYLSALGIAQSSTTDLTDVIDRALLKRIQSESVELKNTALRLVDEHGNCAERDGYERLMSRIRHWNLGSPSYFMWLNEKSGYTIPDYLPAKAGELRKATLRTIIDGITPICDPKPVADGNELNLELIQ